MAKRVLLKALNTVAGIAAVIALFTPFHTATELLVFAVAVILCIICAAVSSNLDEQNVGYWPEQPKLAEPPERESGQKLT